MRLTEILQPDCVKVPLDADDKQGAINELIDLLAQQTDMGDVEELKHAVWQRESTRTTGIGHGIAIPHGKSADLDKLRMAVGRAHQPIEFNAVDKKPVDLIFLLASPADKTGPHIQALAKISRLLTDESLRTDIKSAPSAEDLYQLITDYEKQQAPA